MTNEEVMQLMTTMGLHEGGMDDWVFDNAWVMFANAVAKHTLANIDPSSFMTWQEGYEAGKQTEREACAKICEEVFDTGLVMAPVAPNLAAKIRARGNTKQFEPCPFIECDCDGNHPLNQPAIRARGQA